MFRRSMIGSAVALLWMASSGFAIGVRPVSFQDLCRKADVILCGTAESARCERTGQVPSGLSGGQLIVTDTTFTDLVRLKGLETDSSETYVLRTLGGTIGDDGLKVPGMPTFQPGERYILFVMDNGQAACPLIGAHQGCFKIVKHRNAPDTVRTFRGRDPQVGLVPAIRDGAIKPSGDGVPGALSLDVFLTKIRDVLERDLSLRSDTGGDQ